MKHVSATELSAHADGAARDPNGIAAHLAACPACARRLEELRQMTAALRALPEPKEAPYFVSRVEAYADEALPRWRRQLRLKWGLAVGTTFVGAILLTSFLFLLFPTRQMPTDIPAPPIAYDHRWQSDDEVVTALAAMLEEGGEAGLFETGMVETEADYEETSAAQLLTRITTAAAGEGMELVGLEDMQTPFDEIDFSGDIGAVPWIQLMSEEG